MNKELFIESLNELNIDFVEDVGEAAFYGPKLDIQAKNVYGKEDTMITIQLDLALAEQFDMYFIDENGEKKRPFIIHRTSMGCYERTLAWLIEKYAGLFPTWLCPEQVRVLPISEKYQAYADSVLKELKANGIRASVDGRAEKIGYKIREARLNKVPYMLSVPRKKKKNLFPYAAVIKVMKDRRFSETLSMISAKRSAQKKFVKSKWKTRE